MQIRENFGLDSKEKRVRKWHLLCSLTWCGATTYTEDLFRQILVLLHFFLQKCLCKSPHWTTQKRLLFQSSTAEVTRGLEAKGAPLTQHLATHTRSKAVKHQHVKYRRSIACTKNQDLLFFFRTWPSKNLHIPCFKIGVGSFLVFLQFFKKAAHFTRSGLFLFTTEFYYILYAFW